MYIQEAFTIIIMFFLAVKLLKNWIFLFKFSICHKTYVFLNFLFHATISVFRNDTNFFLNRYTMNWVYVHEI